MDIYNRCSISILNQFCETELNLLLKDLPDSQFKSEIVDGLAELKETMEENSNKNILQEAFEDDRLLDLPPEYEKEFRNVRLVYYGGILTAILLILYLNYFSKNRYQSTNKYEYLRDFPSDIKPSAITYLMMGKITSKALSADILDLIQRNIIVATKEIDDEKNYILKINAEKYDACSDDDQLLIKMLFADKEMVTMKDIKKEALYNKKSFHQRCYDYVYCLMSKYRRLGYFDIKLMSAINSIGRGVFIILLIVTIFHASCFLLKMVNQNLEPGWAHYPMATYTLLVPMIFIGCLVFLLVILSRIIIRTRYGQEEYYKWQAFKKFLITFGLMDEKKVLEVFLWEKYLVYATALDCADLVEKRLGFAFFGGFTEVQQEIFSADLNYFNDSLTTDFDTVIESCNRGVNKQFKKEEKAKKKLDKRQR